MEYFLLAITPSEDIVIKIRNLRNSIFREFGLISSKCLPVIIPIAFSEKTINKDLFLNIKLTKSLTTSNIFLIEEQNIILGIRHTNIIEEIADYLNLSKKKGFISTGKGFYIGTAKTSLQADKILKYLSIKSIDFPKWKINYLKLIKITTENKNWWESIMWETVWSKKVYIKFL